MWFASRGRPASTLVPGNRSAAKEGPMPQESDPQPTKEDRRAGFISAWGEAPGTGSAGNKGGPKARVHISLGRSPRNRIRSRQRKTEGPVSYQPGAKPQEPDPQARNKGRRPGFISARGEAPITGPAGKEEGPMPQGSDSQATKEGRRPGFISAWGEAPGIGSAGNKGGPEARVHISPGRSPGDRVRRQ